MELNQDSSVEAGGVLANRYRIEKLLGQGGMGKVYLVSDTMLEDEKIALKLLKEELCTDQKHTRRFIREVQLNRMLTHPNVVKIFDAGSHEGALFLTMEYIAGESLKDRMSSAPLEISDCTHIIKEICKGLSAVHAANIIHRDMKPGNVLLGDDGSVKIADFGVARPGISDLTAHDEVIGCAPYIAPEVWMGKNVGTLADLYALGIIAYEMLTQELPFDADSPGEMMRKHLDSKPFPINKLNPGVPRWLSLLVLQMLEKDPRDRPGSPEKIIEALEQRENAAAKATRGGLSLDSGLLNALQDVKIKQSTFDDPETDTSFKDHGAFKTSDYSSEHSDYKETTNDDWLLTPPAEIEEEPLTSLLSGGGKDKVHPDWHFKSPTPGKLKKSVVKPAVKNIGSLARRKKRKTPIIFKTAVKRESIIPFLFANFVQICILFLLTAVVIYVVQFPAAGAVQSLWGPVFGNSPIFIVAFLGYVLSIVMCSLLCAVPFALISILSSSYEKRFSVWAAVWSRTALYLSICCIGLFSVNLVRVAAATADYSVSELDTIYQILRTTMRNIIEVACLLPNGTVFATTMDKANWIIVQNSSPTVVESFPYYVCLAVFLVMLSLIIKRHIFGVASERAHYVFTAFFGLIIPLILLQYLIRPAISHFLKWVSQETHPIPFGPFIFQMSEYSLASAALNWTAVLILVTIVIPVIARTNRRR